MVVAEAEQVVVLAELVVQIHLALPVSADLLQ
jgi:hypothetical protein